MPSQLLQSVSIAALMLLGMAQARGLMDSYKSVYFSSYCQKYRCVLERKTFSHTDGVDFLVYRYRLRDGSSLLVSRFEPFDRREKSWKSDYTVAVLALELGKAFTTAQLERRLSELLNLGIGSSLERWRFDFAHKCTRPGQAWYPYNGDEVNLMWSKRMARDYTLETLETLETLGKKYELTCVWDASHWQLYLHGGFIFPLGDGGLTQVWP